MALAAPLAGCCGEDIHCLACLGSLKSCQSVLDIVATAPALASRQHEVAERGGMLAAHNPSTHVEELLRPPIEDA